MSDAKPSTSFELALTEAVQASQRDRAWRVATAEAHAHEFHSDNFSDAFRSALSDQGLSTFVQISSGEVPTFHIRYGRFRQPVDGTQME